MNLDKIAREYHLKPQSDMFIENICQEYELRWVKKTIRKGSKVLELGFGDGVTFRNLAHYCELSVVDGSQLMTEKAESVAVEIGASSRIIESYFETFAPTDKYDYIFASHVLEHVDHPDLVMQRMKTWLNPNGLAIVIVPNAQSVHRRLAVLMEMQPELDTLSKRDLIVGHQRVYSLQDLFSLCSDTGWKINESRGFFMKPFSNSQLENFDPTLIKALCQVSDEIPPELCANLALVISPE